MVRSSHCQCYRKLIALVYDKKVKSITLQEGGLVLKKILPFSEDAPKKFRPNFEGLYVVTEVLSGGAVHLSGVDRDTPHELVNSGSIKMYFLFDSQT